MLISPAKKIFLLASYPKSGNTWIRSFISASRNIENNDSDSIVDINKLQIGDAFITSYFLEQNLGFDISELPSDHIQQLRKKAHQWAAMKMDDYHYVKIHDVNHTADCSGNKLFDSSIVEGALYIVRNPLDVVPSLANHMGYSIDQAIDFMNNDTAALSKNEFGQYWQPEQYLSSWSRHVDSWVQKNEFNVRLVRYEDLLYEAENSFTSVAQHLKLGVTKNDILSAIQATKFSKLKEQEQNNGFTERAVNQQGFFRKGISGDWKNNLNEEQVDKIIQCHDVTMAQLGYLDKSGNPVY